MVKIGLVLLSVYVLLSLTIPTVNFLFPTAIRHLVFMNTSKIGHASTLFICLVLISQYSGQFNPSGVIRSRSRLAFLPGCGTWSSAWHLVSGLRVDTLSSEVSCLFTGISVRH